MRARCLLVIVMVGLTSLAIGGVAAAQDLAALLGRTVTAVRFEIEGVPDTSTTLAGLSDVRVSQPLPHD